MSKLLEFPNPELTREQAAMWIARLDRGLDAAEQAELRRWCASPINARALQEMTALWQNMDVMKVLAQVLPEPQPQPAVAASSKRWRPAIAAGLAACLAVVGFIAYRQLVLPQPATFPDAAALTYITSVGEHRSVPLTDGSILAINTDSIVQIVSMQGALRELRLLRGEAHFKVAHDPSHPFRVHVGKQTVQAVGTAFDIRLHADHSVEVLVTEGRVKLIPANAATDHLDRGQILTVGADGHAQVATLDSAALTQRLAWRDGMIVFDGQTLATALEEFSRYTHMRITVSDRQLRQLRVGGYFPAGDTAFLLDALRTNFGLSAVTEADGTIRIVRRR